MLNKMKKESSEVIRIEKQKLVSQIKPMLIRGWNLNNVEKCYDVNISFAYFPEEFDGNNPPIVRYNLIMESGREQSNFNCDKPFVEMIGCIIKCIYEKTISYKKS